MAFYVGQKVECLTIGPLKTGLPALSLKAGHIYTVARYSRAPDGHMAVWLVEATAVYPEYGYLSERFRPVIERKTDISIFKAMLNPSKQEVSA
ncbi:hypothetical protein [Bosea sp. AS-1]|uniref:hypothetical protein n=1 Tax=Bosea sp. AS-1 TaxID=2015316 RepID=UPI0012FD8309|nr:hypothetical protein [Bosea sp. AS-1]